MPARSSAAYFILVIAVAYLVINGLITLLATPWDTILGSAFFSFDTQWGQNFASWQRGLFNWLGMFSLIALLLYGFIRSRRATT